MNRKKVTVDYILMNIVFWCGYAVIWSYTAVYLEYAGYNNLITGLVTGIGAVISVIMQPVLASLINKYEQFDTRTNMIGLKLISVMIAVVIMIKPAGHYTIALLFMVLAAMEASIPSMLSTLAMEFVNSGCYVNYGLARGCGSIAYALFSLFLGYAVIWFKPSVLMICYLVLSSVFLMMSFLFPKTEQGMGQKSREKKSADRKKSLTGLFSKYPFLLSFMLASIFLFMGHNMINIFLVRIIERAGGSSSNLGLALAIAAGVELPVMGYFVKLSRKFKISGMLLFSALFFVLKSILTLFSIKQWMIYIAQFLQFGAFALFTPASVYFINQSMEEEDSGIGQALLGACSLGLGGAFGNVLGGFVIERTNVAGMLICSIVLGIVGFFCMLRSYQSCNTNME